jgi:predicted aconitase with swiveling domain
MIKGLPSVPGKVADELLVSNEPISFWGGYDQFTGEIIDRRHPLAGQIAAGNHGSSVGSNPPGDGSQGNHYHQC